MASTFPSPDTLQSILLHALDAAPISDTRDLVLSLPSTIDGSESLAGSRAGARAEEQNAIKGALDSLGGREVGAPARLGSGKS